MPEEWYLPEKGLRTLLESVDCRRRAADARLESRSARMGTTTLWLPLQEITDEQLTGGMRSVRPRNSAKFMLTPERDLVARYGASDLSDPLDDVLQDSSLIAGVRGCECRALSYMDKVMLREPVAEPFYKSRRENCTVVSVDCVTVEGCRCFCNLIGDRAYPEANYDINLSPIAGGYLVVAGSEKGEAILSHNRVWLQPATDEHRGQRQAMRDRTAQQLAAQNAEFTPTSPQALAAIMPKELDELFWSKEMEVCVQCGGCTQVCPTCYCFLLYDRRGKPAGFERTRAWDSCQLTGYTVMAGPPGTMRPDPRRDHMSKFQRRFMHKFWHDVLVNDMLGCVACGRCIETCPGLIDLRRVITALHSVKSAG